MAGAYDDNYWNDAGQGGVAGSGDAYADSGNTNEPDWAKDDNQQIEVVQQAPSKKDKKKNDSKKSKKKRKTTEDEVRIEKKECCNPRLKRYMGTWTILLIIMAVGIILLAIGIIPVGLILFFAGLIGLVCTGYCFRKCDCC